MQLEFQACDRIGGKSRKVRDEPAETSPHRHQQRLAAPGHQMPVRPHNSLDKALDQAVTVGLPWVVDETVKNAAAQLALAPLANFVLSEYSTGRSSFFHGNCPGWDSGIRKTQCWG